MWSHDERKEISNTMAASATIRCPKCGKTVKKYVESHYTGGIKCVLLAKYCHYCWGSLNNGMEGVQLCKDGQNIMSIP